MRQKLRMEIYLATARGVFTTLWPLALVFALLAALTKRQRLLAAIRRCRSEAATNLGLVVVNYIILAPIMAVPVAAVAAVVPVAPFLPAFWLSLPEPLTLVAALLLIEFGAYWRHRLEHDAALWRFHATHHADEQIHWLTVLRKHPVGKLIEMLLDNLPILILGVPVWAVIGANLLRSWWSYFIHADVPWTLGAFGRVLISPAAHRLHHVRDEALMGSNYGNMLTVWDRLFGTYVDPAPHINCATGIAEGSRGLWGELARPWERRYRTGSKAAEPGEAMI